MLPAWLRSFIDRWVPAWLRSFVSPKLHDVSYYRKRLDLLVFPAGIVNLYYFYFLFLVYKRKLILPPEGQEFEYTAFYVQIGLLMLIFFGGYTAIRKSQVISLWSLVISTICFIFTISLPVFYWGGSNHSFFSPILATLSGLTVLFTRGKWTRTLFFLLCIAVYIACAYRYDDIVLNDKAVLFSYSGKQVYAFLQTFSAVLSILITFVLGWRSKTIFGDDEDDGTLQQSS